MSKARQLREAIEQKDLEAVKAALEDGACPDKLYERLFEIKGSTHYKKPLKEAIDSDSVEIVEALVAAGANVSFRLPKEEGVEDGTRILLYAVQQNKPEMVKALMKSSTVDVNQESTSKETAIGHARKKGYLNIEAILKRETPEQMIDQAKALEGKAKELREEAKQLLRKEEENSKGATLSSGEEKSSILPCGAVKAMPDFKKGPKK